MSWPNCIKKFVEVLVVGRVRCADHRIRWQHPPPTAVSPHSGRYLLKRWCPVQIEPAQSQQGFLTERVLEPTLQAVRLFGRLTTVVVDHLFTSRVED